jgi:hypothetical protein
VTSSCPGWQLQGYRVASGNVWYFESSILELTVTLTRPGSVSFMYFVDSALGYSGLIFMVRHVCWGDRCEQCWA